MSRLIRPVKNFVRNVSTDMITKPVELTYRKSLMLLPETKLTTFKENGLKIATEDTGNPMATIGVFLQAGSRYEGNAVNGIANLFEHMCFQGTDKRSQLELEKEVNSMGAHIYACTTRDKTTFYAKCFKEDVPHAMEILSDIIQHSKFDEKVIEKRKKIILNDIEESSKNLTLVAHDLLHACAFQATALARTILGTAKSVSGLVQEDLEDYRLTHLKPSRMVIAGAGGVNHEQMVELTKKHFNALPKNYDGNTPDPGPPHFTGSEITFRDDDLPFAHVSLAIPTAGWKDPDNLSLAVASNIIGSWDRTYAAGAHNASKLAEIIYKNDYARAFQQFHTMYDDMALWGNYFVCDRNTLFDFVFHLCEEWVRLATEASDFEVTRGKNILRTNYLARLADTTSLCEDIGSQVLIHGRRVSIPEFEQTLNAIDASKVRSVLMDHIYDKDYAAGAIGPVENLPDYHIVRLRLYKLLM